MYESFIRERVAQLRAKTAVSARDMSLTLEQAKAILTKIETGKTLPPMAGLFYICDYFKITPEQFFNTSIENPMLINSITKNLFKLSNTA